MSDDPTGGELGPGTAPAPSENWASQRKADQAGLHPPVPPRREQPANPNAAVRPAWSDGLDMTSRHRLAAEARRAAADGEPGAAPTGTPTTAPAGADSIKIGDVTMSAREVAELASFKAAEDSRRLTLPTKPEEYEATLPKDFKLPQGFEYTVDPNDPILPHARDFALKAGLSKEQFQTMVALHAQADIARQMAYRDRANAEVLKLGASGTERVTAIQNFLKAQLGDELARDFFFSSVSSARNVEAVEKLMANARSQGGGTFSTTGREPPSSKGQLEVYESLPTFEAKRAFQESLRRNAAR
jgi:hypothetical protein